MKRVVVHLSRSRRTAPLRGWPLTALFVVWTGNLTRITTTSSQGGGSVSYNVNVDGNVVEYPKARVVGYSIFAGSKGQSCCLFGKSEGEDINEMLKDSAGMMADKFISAAKAEKPGR